MGRTSDKRERILAYIREYQQEHGYSPSLREIGDAVDLKSTSSVHYQLSRLQEDGLLSSDGAKSRTLSLPVRAGHIPVVGLVTAGQPILASEHIEGYIPWEGDSGCFALRVRGDSMKNAGILSGDTVIVRPQQDAENGEIVVALLGEEATVKRFQRRGDEIWLVPENPAYEPIDGREAMILGRVKAVLREY